MNNNDSQNLKQVEYILIKMAQAKEKKAIESQKANDFAAAGDYWHEIGGHEEDANRCWDAADELYKKAA
jgi:hypothetical protein